MSDRGSDVRVGEFYTTLDRWCAATGRTIFSLALACEYNDRYFYQARRRRVLPPIRSLPRVAAVLRVPYVSLLIAAGYLCAEDLEAYPGVSTDPVALPASPTSSPRPRRRRLRSGRG